jgi:hypothetical protein
VGIIFGRHANGPLGKLVDHRHPETAGDTPGSQVARLKKVAVTV